MDTIVVGYDGSEHAQRALARAVELYPHEAHVVVSAMPILVDPRPALVRHGFTAVEHEVETETETDGHEQHLRERDRVLDEARHLLAGQDATSTFVGAFGDAAYAITEAALEHDAKLIVVGTRGRNLLERFLLGSVSTKVVHHAPCDVLVVR